MKIGIGIGLPMPAVGGGGVAPPLILDTFTGTNGTALSAHPPDIGAGSWTAHVGSWTIQGNRGMLIASAGDNQNVASIDAGLANATAEVDVILGGLNADVRLVFNFVDANNFWMFTLNDTGTSFLYERSGGTFTSRGSYASGTPGVGTFRLKVITLNDGVTCFLDDVLKVTYTVGARPHKTATRFGISQLGGYDSTSQWDNFRVAA